MLHQHQISLTSKVLSIGKVSMKIILTQEQIYRTSDLSLGLPYRSFIEE